MPDEDNLWPTWKHDLLAIFLQMSQKTTPILQRETDNNVQFTETKLK